MSRHGSYGPVYDCNGTLIDFMSDDTPCRNIIIRNNIFKCDGFDGVGHHGDIDHHDIIIENNIFDGPSGRIGKSRGYIFFRPMVYNLTVRNNAFLSPEETDSPSYGIILENPDISALTAQNNVFSGKFDKEIIREIK